MSKPSVAVVGAAGFVGQSVAAEFSTHGWRVFAVTPRSRSFLLSRLDVEVLDPADVSASTGFDLVVNLAYPNRGLAHHHRARNREIVSLLRRLLKPGGRLLHTSTLAVFGVELERPVQAALPPATRADAYVESKSEMEHMLARAFEEDGSLEIVRLGNVWGPGSALWTGGMLQRLFNGSPVRVAGQDGWSNVTDVANVASYLRFLAEQDAGPRLRFHHLAEHSHHRWSEFLDPLTELAGIEPVSVGSLPGRPAGMGAEIRAAMRSAFSPKEAGKGVWFAKTLGSCARSALRCLPPRLERRLLDRVKASFKRSGASLKLTTEDAGFLRIMTCPREFAPLVVPGWQPARSFPESISAAAGWARHVGFC